MRTPWLTLRSQLTLLYAGFLVAAGVAVLAVPIFTIRAGLPADASPHEIALMNASSRAQELRAAVTLVGLGAASLVVGWLIAGRFLRPLRTITATARDISASNLNRRLNPGARDNEFAELGATLNDLFGRLEASFESQRRFVANASHELRTPLSAGRTLLQIAVTDPGATVGTLKETCQEVLEVGDQQEHLIGALLTLATSQRGLARSEPLDLADITGGVLVARQDEAGRCGIQISATLAPAPATGDPNLTESLVTNLVDNAIRHNHPGGYVEICTTPAAAGAQLTVRNTGPVIQSQEVAGLFEPFRQAGPERIRSTAGHGLGLAIVRAIADAHQAALTATSRPQGGLDIQLTFPPRQTPANRVVPAATAPAREARIRGVRAGGPGGRPPGKVVRAGGEEAKGLRA
jgi:signal transduction histidine kinase